VFAVLEESAVNSSLYSRPAIPASHHERPCLEMGANFTGDTFNFEQIANITQM